MTFFPERLKPESDTVKSGRVNFFSHLTPVVTNLFQNKLSSLHEQLIPEKDENVWVKRGKDDDKQTKANPGKENIDSYHRPVNGINASNISEQDGDYTTPGNEAGNNENERTLQNEKLAKELQANKESEKDESTLISKQEQKLKTSKEEEEERQTEKVKEPGDEDREKQKQIENAREEEERRKEIKQEEQKKREQEEQEILQQQLDIEKEKERQKQLEKQKQLEIEKKKEQEKQRRLEKAKEEREKTQKIEKEKEREREKLQQLENQKQHKLEIEKEKEREKEKQRKLEKSREEREKSREMEREKQQLEKERKQELELQKENQRDKQRELEKAKDEERLKQDQREIEKTKETEKEKERLKQKDLPKEREKLDKKDDSKDKKDKPKMEKRGSSSSLMAQTKSSWRKSLGFSGFKSKEKKEDKREPFANTLRTSDFPKKSEKVLFRDKRGKVSAEERRSKSKSLGDLEARLKPLREEIHLDQSSTRGLSTEDIPTDSQAGASLPPPFTDRRSPVGKDGEGKNVSKFQIYQDAVNQLNQAIKSITDLHAQVLEEDNSDDKEEMLALLTNTFTDTEEHCKQLRMRSTEVFKPRNRSMASNFSFSMNNLDTLATSSQPAMHRRASEASVPTAVEQEDASRDLLMRYSDILVEMVKQKLST
ncbi:DNA ligase 1 [Exaiptasia diaphana]|uniref:Uncharacterized protein n=1 Tax=Exaiptasia diaphana TaxID=2652724 RepID=A0A913YM84_EXADI|nr:DNA ligase 1 [Exaiptasia diaphana]